MPSRHKETQLAAGPPTEARQTWKAAEELQQPLPKAGQELQQPLLAALEQRKAGAACGGWRRHQPNTAQRAVAAARSGRAQLLEQKGPKERGGQVVVPTALLLQKGQAQLEGPRRLAVARQKLWQVPGVAVAGERELRRLAKVAAAVALGQRLFWQPQLRQPRLALVAAVAA